MSLTVVVITSSWRPARLLASSGIIFAVPVFGLTDDPGLFPDPQLADADGLLAVGGDLSAERLVAAYAAGIFPWFEKGQPILWWSPDPRMVLAPNSLHVPRSLAKS